MDNGILVKKLGTSEISVTLESILDNSRANSGGERDLNFLKFLVDNNLLTLCETVLKRKYMNFPEEYYLERYKKINFESDRHFLCRTIIQDELEKMGIKTIDDVGVGYMDILRSNSNYDIVTDDFSTLIDVGLTPARNYFRGLTDLKAKNYLITTYFDDYIDDIIFGIFSRKDDRQFIDAVKDYEESFKIYIPNPIEHFDERKYYNEPSFPE